MSASSFFNAYIETFSISAIFLLEMDGFSLFNVKIRSRNGVEFGGDARKP